MKDKLTIQCDDCGMVYTVAFSGGATYNCPMCGHKEISDEETYDKKRDMEKTLCQSCNLNAFCCQGCRHSIYKDDTRNVRTEVVVSERAEARLDHDQDVCAEPDNACCICGCEATVEHEQEAYCRSCYEATKDVILLAPKASTLPVCGAEEKQVSDRRDAAAADVPADRRGLVLVRLKHCGCSPMESRFFRHCYIGNGRTIFDEMLITDGEYWLPDEQWGEGTQVYTIQCDDCGTTRQEMGRAGTEFTCPVCGAKETS